MPPIVPPCGAGFNWTAPDGMKQKTRHFGGLFGDFRPFLDFPGL